MRRCFLALLAALYCGLAGAAPPDASLARRNVEDFDAFWRAIDSGYAYFDGGSRGAWRRARETWRPKAAAAKTREEFLVALEGAAAHLRDDHVTFSERSPTSARTIPSETDIWAQWKNGAAVVTAVRPFGDADVAGLHPGHVVTHVNGRPIERVTRERLQALGASGPVSMDWALRQALAGPRAGVLKVAVRDATSARTITIERRPAVAASGPPLLARRMGDERDVGYIRIRNALGDPALPAAFEAALGYLGDTRALLLDLRETMDDGARSIVDSIVAYFVARGARETSYRAPVIVLVDRWTAGEGEALAAALQDGARATLVGTPMAGLRGRLAEVKLPNSGIVVRFPGEKSTLANGAPRETLRPAIEVDPTAPSGGPGDPILYQALKFSERFPPSPARGDRNGPR